MVRVHITKTDGEGSPPSPAHIPRYDHTGFSLIEVLTLLVVLGIVTSIAVPRLDVQRYQIEGAMQSVGSTLLTAQRAAVQRQHNVIVSFDAANSRIRIHGDVDNDRAIDQGEPVRWEALGDGVRFGRAGAPALFGAEAAISFSLRQNGLPAVVFSRNGAASEEGGFYLTSARALRDAAYARDTRALRIDRSTGRAGWYRLNGTQWTREF